MGHVTFTAREAHFVLFCFEDDPISGSGASTSSPRRRGELPHHVRAANMVNEAAKGVNVVLAPDEDTVRFTVETFLTGNATPQLVERSTHGILNAATSFFSERRPPKDLDA